MRVASVADATFSDARGGGEARVLGREEVSGQASGKDGG